MAGPYDWIDDDRDERPRETEPRRFSDDAGRFDRYEPGPAHRGDRGRWDRRADEARAYAEHLREVAGRGFRQAAERMDHMRRDLRRRVEEDQRPEDVKPGWRAGGMFGGDDRSNSLFSHGNGAPGPASEGPHRGKGPRNYIRSDDRICEDINDRLLADGRLDASDVEVRVEAGEATLSGHVLSREDKRRAEDLAESVSGVRHLQNNLRVSPPKEPRPASQTSAQPERQPTVAKPAPSPEAASPDANVDPHGPDTSPRLN